MDRPYTKTLNLDKLKLIPFKSMTIISSSISNAGTFYGKYTTSGRRFVVEIRKSDGLVYYYEDHPVTSLRHFTDSDVDWVKVEKTYVSSDITVTPTRVISLVYSTITKMYTVTERQPGIASDSGVTTTRYPKYLKSIWDLSTPKTSAVAKTHTSSSIVWAFFIFAIIAVIIAGIFVTRNTFFS